MTAGAALPIPPRFVHLFDLSDIPNAVIVATMCTNLLGIAMPLVALQVYDRIIPNAARETLAVLILGLIGVIVIEAAMKVTRGYLIGWKSARNAALASVQAAATVVRTSPIRLARERETDWLDRIEAAAEVEAGRGGQARLVILDLAFLPIFPIIIGLVGGALVVVPLIVIALIAIGVWRRGRMLEQVINDRTEHDRRRHDFLTECLGAIRTVKALAMEPQMMRRFERLQKSSALTSMRAIETSQSVQILTNLMASLAMVSIVTVGVMMIIYGDLTIGSVACCSLLSGRLMQPVLRGAGVWAEFQNLVVAEARAEPLAALAETAPAPGRELAAGPASLSLHAITYSDPDTGSQVLDGASLDVAAGEIVGLKGASGMEWSVLFDIVCGDRAQSAGQVLIDGREAAVFGPALRRRAVRVSSRSQLFQGTVLENLTLFRGGEVVDRARRIARELGLEARIDRLPNGYDTQVGAGVGNDLPEGIVQQIAIARALVREPSILMFDEANTALDAEGDAALRQTIADRAGKITVLLVSNRPSILNLGSRCFEIADGRLRDVQSGASDASAAGTHGAAG